jgi:xylose isomerase
MATQPSNTIASAWGRDWSLFPVDGHYMVLKPFTVSNYTFQYGDVLPAGSSVRQNQKLLAQLVEQRRLRLMTDAEWKQLVGGTRWQSVSRWQQKT